MTADTTEFIRGAGGSIASRRILDGVGGLKWAFREESVNSADNGWRFLAAEDDAAYLDVAENMVVSDFNVIAGIEPAIIAIYGFPVGSDLQLVIEDGRRSFVDNATGRTVVGGDIDRES